VAGRPFEAILEPFIVGCFLDADDGSVLGSSELSKDQAPGAP
jgi:hypothetical protein